MTDWFDDVKPDGAAVASPATTVAPPGKLPGPNQVFAPAVHGKDGQRDWFDNVRPDPPEEPTVRSAPMAGLRAGLDLTGSIAATTAGEALRSVPQVIMKAADPLGVTSHAMKAIGVGTPEDWYPTKRRLMIQYKNDPAGFEREWNSPQYAPFRDAEMLANRASSRFEHLTEQGKQVVGMEYTSMDPQKGVLPNVVKNPGMIAQRIATDAATMIPGVAASALSIIAAKNPVAGAVAGASIEGGVEGMISRQQVRQELEAAALSKWENVPLYLNYIKAGYHPTMARRMAIEELSTEAAVKTGIASAAVSALGGAIVGHGAAAGAGVARRGATGVATQGTEEFVQEGAGQIVQNQAAIKSIDPGRDVMEGVGENAVAGAVVGGVTGGATNMMVGRNRVHSAASVANPPSGGFNVGNIRAGGLDAGFRTYATAPDAVAATIRNAQAYPKAFNGGQPMPLWDSTIDLAKVRAGDPVETAKARKTIAGNWAPATATGSDNPAVWAGVVAKAMGIDVNAPIDLTQPGAGAAFARGVHTIEHGPKALYADADYTAGEALALSGTPVNSVGATVPGTVPGATPQQQSDAIAAHLASLQGLNQSDSFLEEDKNLVINEKDAQEGKDQINKAQKPTDNPETVAALTDPTEVVSEAGTVIRTGKDDPFAGIKPKHNRRPIDFPDPESKALFLHGMAGEAHPEFAKFLMDTTGLSMEEINKLSKAAVAHIRSQINPDVPTSQSATFAEIRAAVDNTKSLTKGKYGLPKPDTTEAPTELAGREDIGRTPYREASGKAYPNRNNNTPLLERTVMFGTGKGKKLKEVAVKPGTVLTAAEPSIHYPHGYAQAAHSTVEAILKKFAPTARVILTHLTPKRGVLGSMRNHRNGFYEINLPYALKIGEPGYDPNTTYNKDTLSTLPWVTTHEMGHVVVDSKFFEGTTLETQKAIDLESKGMGLISDETIAKFGPAQQAVLREYNATKQRFMTDPELKATDFITAWFSPWKVGRGVGKANEPGPAHQARKAGERADQLTAAQYMQRIEQEGDTLSFHEYMAEQFARYVYKKDLLKGTAFGDFFKKILSDLKELFKELKLQKAIAPGKAFNDWIEGVAKAPGKVSRSAKGMEFVPNRKADPARFDSFIDEPGDGYYPPMPQEHADLVSTRDLINHVHYEHLPANIVGEANELLDAGQVEQARELVETHLARPDIIAWDGTAERYDTIRSTFQSLDRIPSTRSAMRRFMGTGLRRLADFTWWTTDLRQRAAAMPDNSGLVAINNTLTNYRAYIGKLQSEAMPIVQRWSKLASFWGGSRRADALSAALLDELENGVNLPNLVMDQNGRYKWEMSDAFRRHAQKHGLDAEMAQLYLDIKGAYTRHMMALAVNRRGVYQRKINELKQIGTPDALKRIAYYTKRKKLLAEDFDRALKLPFLPQTRFGPYQIEVSELNSAGEVEVIHVEGYDTPEASADAAAKLRNHPDMQGRTIREQNITTSEAILRVLPLEVLNGDMSVKLTAKQRATLYRTAGAITADPKTRKYSPALGKITGHSDSTLKAFADFMHHDSLVLAKLEHRDIFHDGLKVIEAEIQLARGMGDSDRQHALETSLTFAQGYVQQILNPAAEYHAWRSAVVLKDLAFNIKSAVANLTGLINSWATITTREGLVRGTYTFSKTQAQVTADYIARAAQAVTRAPIVGWENAFTPDERLAMKHAAEMGLFYEGHSAQLAGYGQTGVLERMALGSVKRRVDQIARVGMAPFQLIDEYTRQVTYLGAFRAYRRQGMELADAFDAAVKDTYLLQGDNSIHNRAPMMRGAKSLGLIYFNYMRGMTWLFSGGYGRARAKAEKLGTLPKSSSWTSETVKMWAAYALLGGVMGLPGAEDLEKILELVSRQLFSTRFSLREHAYDLAHMIVQNTNGLGMGMSPRSLVHGFASDIFGADISGSIGLGNMLPGAGGLSQLGGRDAEKFWLELLGPFGRNLEQSLALFDESMPWEKRYAVAIPSAIQNIIKAIDKDPRAKSGARVHLDPDTGQITELSTGQMIAQGLGFTQTAIAQNRELSWMQNSYAAYWTTRRSIMMAQVWDARLQNDPAMLERAVQAVQRFNTEAPTGLAISASQLTTSLKNRQRRMALEELGLARQKSMRPAFEQMRTSFGLPPRQ